MDNVTHTLIGITLAEAVTRKRPELRKAALWTSVIGNNFADLDFLMPESLAGGNLGYMLEHRGYTHTVLSALPIATIAYAVGAFLLRKQSVPKLWLATLALCATLMHLGADFWNDYGVHPWVPFSNQWVYGDFVFIVEPLMWLTLLPFVFFHAQQKFSRGVCIALGLIMLGLIWFGPFVPTVVAIVLSAWALASVFIQKRSGGWKAAVASIALVLITFFSTSRIVKSQTQAAFAAHLPSEKIIQLATSPAPGNPFCWRVITASKKAAEAEGGETQYIARVGGYSFFPESLPLESCYFRVSLEKTAPLQPSTLPSSSKLSWGGEFQGSFKRMQELADESCTFAGLLQFARIPFWTEQGPDSIAGDLRFDYQKEASRFEIEFRKLKRCPAPVPWDRPVFPQSQESS